MTSYKIFQTFNSNNNKQEQESQERFLEEYECFRRKLQSIGALERDPVREFLFMQGKLGEGVIKCQNCRKVKGLYIFDRIKKKAIKIVCGLWCCPYCGEMKEKRLLYRLQRSVLQWKEIYFVTITAEKGKGEEYIRRKWRDCRRKIYRFLKGRLNVRYYLKLFMKERKKYKGYHEDKEIERKFYESIKKTEKPVRLEYFGVVERGQDQEHIHLHLLMNFNISYYLLQAISWSSGLGFVYIKKVAMREDEKEDVCRYMMKYFMKEREKDRERYEWMKKHGRKEIDKFKKNKKKRFFSSKGLLIDVDKEYRGRYKKVYIREDKLRIINVNGKVRVRLRNEIYRKDVLIYRNKIKKRDNIVRDYIFKGYHLRWEKMGERRREEKIIEKREVGIEEVGGFKVYDLYMDSGKMYAHEVIYFDDIDIEYVK